MKKLLVAAASLLVALGGMAQTSWSGQSTKKNYISTGIPILMVAPDAASAGMGDAGVASLPDAYSAHWNNAKFAFIDAPMGASMTYTPWLRNLKVGDMNLFYLGAFYRVNSRSTAALSLTYFTLGDIDMTDIEGNKVNTLHPNEFAFDGTYALKLTDRLSIGATGRFIRSDLTNGQNVTDDAGTTETHSANSLAADIGVYYQQPVDNQQEFALGAFISNLGAKLSYSDDDNDKEFLPANLRIGGRYTNRIDEYNKITALVDINKMLVPTPPYSGETRNAANMTEYNRIGAIQGALQSFNDAPGGMSEELQELQFSVGAEYWYAETFAARAGYFFEHENKGGRQYITVGFGLRYNVFVFDFAYLVPTTTISSNPLANTMRISLSVNMAPGD